MGGVTQHSHHCLYNKMVLHANKSKKPANKTLLQVDKSILHVLQRAFTIVHK